MSIKLPKERVNDVSPNRLRDYLVSHGWKRDPTDGRPNAEFYYWPSSGKDVAEALLPLEPDVGGYAIVVANAIVAAATVEHRSPFDILDELLEPSPTILSSSTNGNGRKHIASRKRSSAKVNLGKDA